MRDENHSRVAPEEDEVRELFARFGRAYYYADVLHRGLCNLYSLFRIPEHRPMSRLRVEEHLRDASNLTLGGLVRSLEPNLPAALLKQLADAIERRNFLAHHFWYERAHLMPSVDGVKDMIAELDAFTELFETADTEVKKLVEPLNARLGFTSAMFADCMAELLRGEPMEPLPKTRKPDREEVVVGVYSAPSLTTPGKPKLVFVSEDGVVWQLCDAGLGWSPYDSVGATWTPVEKFADLLPARVKPRPQVAAPWNYDIPFGRKATLTVRPGSRPGEVTCGLKRSQ